MTDALTIIFAFESMAAIGYIAWRALSKQERSDSKFRARLDADDERARIGREGRK